MTQPTRAALPVSLVLVLALAACTPAPPPASAPFSVVEASFADMQQAMAEGRVTSRDLVQQYLTRIAYYEDTLNATMVVSRRALEEADRLDEERRQGRVRGPLHGIPIALKDIINTTDMPTTGGALAFEGYTPPYDATLVTLLREAGAVLIAKTVNTELANWVANGMPGNYSAVGGYGMNPYDPRRDPRAGTSDGRPVMGTGGSSSGIGTATNLWAASVGTETSGSILSPSNANMLAGIKPTVGRISRYGIMPITADQDTAGPMAKTVADAAILLGAMEGASPDPNDPATSTCTPPPNRDYTPHLKAGALQGARIGVPRALFYTPATVPGTTTTRGGLNEAQTAQMEEVIALLRAQGAEVVDADIPSVLDPDPAANFMTWGTCAGPDNTRGNDADCSVVFKYGMKRDFNAYVASLGPTAPVKSLTELREFNLANQHRNAIKYGQAHLDVSDEMDVERDRVRYEADRARDILLGGTRGIAAAIEAHQLDALLFPGSGGAGIAAKPGYPTVIVPYGMQMPTPQPPMPDGFELRPGPFGVSFTGVACSEPRLIELAYAFEQATKKRVPPPLFP
ncbi:MAG: amidase family protein [Vicinamibacterales bacterium]|nr:amidase family protein [Vicinamibacterales bacterium]